MQYHQYVEKAYKNIAPYIKKTPILTSSYLSQKTNSTVFLKCENLQYTNCFKVRGAFNKISQLSDKKEKTVIACSGGNHGLAVTFAANQFGMKAIIVVPEFVPQFRIDMIRALGAEVVVFGKTMDDLNAKVAEYTVDPRIIYVHPFDDDEVIAGQGTIAYELLQEIPDLDMILVSIGGGGLISGIAQYAKSFNPAIKIYGSQTIGANAMSESLRANKLVDIGSITSVATSLGATSVTAKTLKVVQDHVENVIVVNDDEAIRDLKDLLDKEKLLVEPAASCNISAILSGKIPDVNGKKIAVILCGGNFSLNQLKTYL